jgi:hypothetical protein
VSRICNPASQDIASFVLDADTQNHEERENGQYKPTKKSEPKAAGPKTQTNGSTFYSEKLYRLTVETKIILVVEVEVEKQQLPEAPISITVMAYYAGFQVLITRRTGEQPILSQVPGIVALVQKLVDAGFEPNKGATQPALPTPEAKDAGSETPIPICQIHKVPMVWREGTNSQTGRHYAFWACPQKNPDGSFCKYKPGKAG